MASPTHTPPRTRPPPPPPPPQSLRPSERQVTTSQQHKHLIMKTINIYIAKDGSLTDEDGNRVSVTASGYAIYDRLGKAEQVQPSGGRPVTREGSPRTQGRPTAPPPPAPAITPGYTQPTNGERDVIQGADSQASLSAQGDNVSDHSHHSQGDNVSIASQPTAAQRDTLSHHSHQEQPDNMSQHSHQDNMSHHSQPQAQRDVDELTDVELKQEMTDP